MIVENETAHIYYYVEDPDTGKLIGDEYGKPFASRSNATKRLKSVKGVIYRSFKTPYWPNARLAMFKLVRLENN